MPLKAILTFWSMLISLTFCVVKSAPNGDFYGADENLIKQPPRYLTLCARKKLDLNDCIKSSMEKFLESSSSGTETLKESNRPSLDPVEVSRLEFAEGSGNVSLRILFRDVRILGFRRMRIENVKSNIPDKKFEIFMKAPCMNIRSRFSAQGGIYTFPIFAEGDFKLIMTNVSFILILHLVSIDDIPGLRFLKVKNCVVDMLARDINASFGDAIDGSYDIGSAFNTFFNHNAQEIFTVVKPKVSKIFAEIFADIADQVLGIHPEDVLLPP